MANGTNAEPEADQTASLDGKQQIGLDLLRGRFQEGQPHEEVEGEDEYQAAVHDVVGFLCPAIECEGEYRPEEDQVSGPEDSHEVHPELSEFTFFVHRMPLFRQLSMLA